jgi:hypothetical protein
MFLPRGGGSISTTTRSNNQAENGKLNNHQLNQDNHKDDNDDDEDFYNNDGLVAIVIGAGPSGLATALALTNPHCHSSPVGVVNNCNCSNGFSSLSSSAAAASLSSSPVCRKVYVVEKHPTFDRRGSTIGLAPNGQNVLQELDPTLKERLLAMGISTTSTSTTTAAANKTTGSDINMNGPLLLVWWELRDALLECAQQRKSSIEILSGYDVTEVIDNNKDDEEEHDDGANTDTDTVAGDVQVLLTDHVSLEPKQITITTTGRLCGGS